MAKCIDLRWFMYELGTVIDPGQRKMTVGIKNDLRPFKVNVLLLDISEPRFRSSRTAPIIID